jgi:hypothetical protein
VFLRSHPGRCAIHRRLAQPGHRAEASCLDFHRSERAVKTPSRWQVREPIYTRSVGRWKAYAEHLPGLTAAFAGLETEPETCE